MSLKKSPGKPGKVVQPIFVAAVLAITGAGFAAVQQSSKREFVPEVKSIAELKPTRPEDIAAAKFFNRYGGDQDVEAGQDRGYSEVAVSNRLEPGEKCANVGLSTAHLSRCAIVVTLLLTPIEAL